ncbi:DsrE family protein [Longitalea arenae]|uniref:DsrE family protein n=1 Tax=Longitalea arenae TaxID=2812558 RepID=UPI001967230B|nr:DsrE family protein [Longitalea arenae]
MKTAVLVFADPKAGSEESLGRLYNALATVYEYKTAGEEVSLYFQGTGTRWPEQLQKTDHPAHQLFKAIEDKVAGISCGCADVFGANAAGFDLIKDNKVPGTTGLPSLVQMQKEGFNILSF